MRKHLMTSLHKLNIDRDEHVQALVYDGAPAQHNPGIPSPNTELKKLLPYRPFLNIVEQPISTLEAAIKADISRPEIQEKMNNREEGVRRENCSGKLSQSTVAILQRNMPTTKAPRPIQIMDNGIARVQKL